jgi:hypothetical protein
MPENFSTSVNDLGYVWYCGTNNQMCVYDKKRTFRKILVVWVSFNKELFLLQKAENYG